MFYGFLLTGIGLFVLLAWGLREMLRVDRVIEQVDERLGPDAASEDRS